MCRQQNWEVLLGNQVQVCGCASAGAPLLLLLLLRSPLCLGNERFLQVPLTRTGTSRPQQRRCWDHFLFLAGARLQGEPPKWSRSCRRGEGRGPARQDMPKNGGGCVAASVEQQCDRLPTSSSRCHRHQGPVLKARGHGQGPSGARGRRGPSGAGAVGGPGPSGPGAVRGQGPGPSEGAWPGAAPYRASGLWLWSGSRATFRPDSG